MNEATKDFINKLRAAREFVATGWTQQMYHNPRTNCFCAQGAMLRAGIEERTYRLRIYNRTLGPEAATSRLIRWNDMKGRTQADVLAMFDNSIAALEAEH